MRTDHSTVQAAQSRVEALQEERALLAQEGLIGTEAHIVKRREELASCELELTRAIREYQTLRANFDAGK